MVRTPHHAPARTVQGGRRSRLLATTVLTVSLGVAGCTGGDGADSEPAGQSTARGLTVSGRWPLTGLPVKGAVPEHPVIVVKIDNSSASNPQVGLRRADLVTEELVEGGATRLAVFFHERLPTSVGPIRSMRATDIGIVKPAKAVLVASGGAPSTVRRVERAGIATFSEGAPGFRRAGDRRAPYNLFISLPALAKTVDAEETVDSYLPFGSAEDLPRGRPASGVAAVFSGGHTTTWRYRGRKYVDQNSFAAAGDRFRPDTVLVLRVDVGDAGYKDPAGNPVPETRFAGTGAALLFHGGRVVRGTWEKTLDSAISLRTRGGELMVPAGHTWIELVPRKGGDVRVTP